MCEITKCSGCNRLCKHAKLAPGDNWIYTKSHDNSARFVLGEKGSNPLICFGINPSTAEPGNLDPTLIQVRNRAKAMGYDGWVMLNVYPQRSTNPKKLHKNRVLVLHSMNLVQIMQYFNKLNITRVTVLAAWGTMIEVRPWLKDCLLSISLGIKELDIDVHWVSIGNLSKQGHPHHPLYLKKDAMVESFDLSNYVIDLFKKG
ncbi:MAG: DUF1643 domain-containing protein [Candidatus Peribacteraceae bacterium]|nr:DUF1643 domain-containing protein [Candidatus Peribacteraceae bacterium]